MRRRTREGIHTTLSLLVLVVIIQKCRSTINLLCQPPATPTQAMGRTALPAYCIEYNESLTCRMVQVRHPTIWHVKLALTWRRRHGPAEVNPTRCPWCSMAGQIVVQDEKHVFFSCQHFQKLAGPKALALCYRRTGSPHCGEFIMSTRLHMRTLHGS
jgi:hypothetical protein